MNNMNSRVMLGSMKKSEEMEMLLAKLKTTKRFEYYKIENDIQVKINTNSIPSFAKFDELVDYLLIEKRKDDLIYLRNRIDDEEFGYMDMRVRSALEDIESNKRTENNTKLLLEYEEAEAAKADKAEYAHIFNSSGEENRLIENLQSSNPVDRSLAAISLGLLNSHLAVPELINTLQDSDKNVRFHAVQALGLICEKSSIPALINRFLDDSNYEIKDEASEALLKFNSTITVPALMKVLIDPNETFNYTLRSYAAKTLLKISNSTTVSVLTKALKNKNPVIRYRAAEALIKLGNPSILPQLKKAMGDTNAEVRKYAGRAFEIWSQK